MLLPGTDNKTVVEHKEAQKEGNRARPGRQVLYTQEECYGNIKLTVQRTYTRERVNRIHSGFFSVTVLRNVYESSGGDIITAAPYCTYQSVHRTSGSGLLAMT